jgi:hypothetical protein
MPVCSGMLLADRLSSVVLHSSILQEKHENVQNSILNQENYSLMHITAQRTYHIQDFERREPSATNCRQRLVHQIQTCHQQVVLLNPISNILRITTFRIGSARRSARAQSLVGRWSIRIQQLAQDSPASSLLSPATQEKALAIRP